MKNRMLSLASLVLFAAPLAAQAKARVPSEFAALVPADAVVFVQVRSLEELAGLVARFQGAAAPDVQGLIEGLDLPGSAELVDPKGTFGFALGLSPQTMQPSPVFLVPTTDAQAFAASLGLAPEQTRASGAFVAVSMQGPAGEAGDGALLRDLEDGLVSARIDLDRLLGAFGPMANMMLSMAETQMQQQMKAQMEAGGTPGIDPSEMMGLYFDFFRDFIASATRLELVLDLHGKEADLRGGLWNKDGSPLAGWGKTEDVDYEALAGRIDAEGAMQFVGAFDVASMMEKFLPMYESMVAGAAEQGALAPEVSAGFQAYLQAARELMPLMSTCAMSADFAADGMRGSVVYGSSDPQRLLQGWMGLLANPALASLGVQATTPETIERGGAKVTALRMNLDPAMLAAMMGAADQPQMMGQFEAIFAAFFGKEGLSFEVGTAGGVALSAFGGDEAYRESAWKRLVAAKGSVPPALAGGVEHIRGCNPAMAINYDFGRLFDGITSVAEKVAPEASEHLGMLADFELALRAWFGVDGSLWKGGVTLDLDQVQSFVQSMMAMGGGVGEDEQGY